MFLHVLLIAFLIMAIPAPPEFKTPKDIAIWAKCSPHKIGYGISQSMNYARYTKWQSSETCLQNKSGDCKCIAVLAKDTLETCDGFSAFIKVIRETGGERRYHAVTLYTNHKGQRGFINGLEIKTFPPGTDWNEIISAISGGPWEAIQQ